MVWLVIVSIVVDFGVQEDDVTLGQTFKVIVV